MKTYGDYVKEAQQTGRRAALIEARTAALRAFYGEAYREQHGDDMHLDAAEKTYAESCAALKAARRAQAAIDAMDAAALGNK